MAMHEFGIMQTEPAVGQLFEEYAPRKYHCIRADDAEIERLLPETECMELYWNTVGCTGKGLADTGVTLIPPGSLPKLREAVSRQGDMAELAALLRRAERENKWVIHYGI